MILTAPYTQVHGAVFYPSFRNGKKKDTAA